jgi:hypothetical protein
MAVCGCHRSSPDGHAHTIRCNGPRLGRFKHVASRHAFQMLSLLLGQLRDVCPEAVPFGASRLELSARIIPNSGVGTSPFPELGPADQPCPRCDK